MSEVPPADQSLDEADRLLDKADEHLREGRDFARQVERDTYPDRQADPSSQSADPLLSSESESDESATPAGPGDGPDARQAAPPGVAEGDVPGNVAEEDASTPPPG